MLLEKLRQLRAVGDAATRGDARARLLVGMSWASLGALSARALALGASILVARTLGAVGFGQLAILQGTIATFSSFAGVGLGMTAARYVANLRDADPNRVSRIIALSNVLSVFAGVTVAAAIVAAAPWLSSTVLASADLAPLLRITSIAVTFTAINGAQIGVLTGLEAFRTLAVSQAAGTALGSVILVAATARWGLVGSSWGLVFNALVLWLVSRVLLARELRSRRVGVKWVGFWGEWRVLFNFSLPATLSGILVTPVNWLASAVLVNTKGGYAEMGVFNAANQWFTAIVMLPSFASQALLPVLSEHLSSAGGSNSRRLSLRLAGMILALSSCAFAVFAIISPFIMSLYGGSLAHRWPVLLLAAATGVVVASLTPLAQFIAASGQMWMGAATNFAWAILFLGLSVVLVHQGADGLAAARLLAYAAHAAWTLVIVRRLVYPTLATQEAKG